jgi:hypothetical protein
VSGIRTSSPVALVRAGNGLDIDTYKSELDCVLGVLNSGTLGRAIDAKDTGWGGAAHKLAIAKVELHIANVKAAIVEQDRRDAMPILQRCCSECGDVECNGECMEAP